MKYKFYDTDVYFNEDNNIIGNDYLELIRLCIKYSKTVTFRIFEYNVSIPKHLQKYQVPINERIVKNYHYYRDFSELSKCEIHHLELSEEVCDWLMSATDNIWGWQHYEKNRLPEDPVFFREDGSVFFHSIIHDGECTIYPKENEDVSGVVSKEHWHCLQD